MGKLAQLLGKEATVRLFLDKFSECCCDEDRVPVRETCARNFGEMCAGLGGDISEFRMVSTRELGRRFISAVIKI